jgi:hypothetical protein
LRWERCPNWVGWLDWISVPCGHIPCSFYTCCYFQNSSLLSGPLNMHVRIILIFLEQPLWDCAYIRRDKESFCFRNAAYTSFTENAIDALYLWMSFQPSYHEWTPKSVFSFERCSKVISIPVHLDVSEWPSHVGERQSPVTLGINVSQSVGLTLSWQSLLYL